MTKDTPISINFSYLLLDTAVFYKYLYKSLHIFTNELLFSVLHLLQCQSAILDTKYAMCCILFMTRCHMQ